MERKMSSKMVQIVLLLISSMLIATASAAVYNLMYMDAAVTPKPAKVYFTTEGADDAAAAGTEVGTNRTYVKFTSLSGWGNATRVYDEVVVIKNDYTQSVTCTLKVASVSGTSNLAKLDFKIGSATLDALTPGNSIDFAISAESSVTVGVRIKWEAGVPGTDQALVTLELTVPGELE